MEDNNFIMFGNYKGYFEMLDEKQVKELVLMLFEYATTKELKKTDDMSVNLVYKTITDNMVIGSRRRMANVQNGKKGGRPKKKKETGEKVLTSEELEELLNE